VRAVTAITYGTSARTKVVVDAGAVPILVRLLTIHCDEVRVEAVWNIGRIAGESPTYRDLVLQSGAVGPLLQQFSQQNADLQMTRSVTMAISNLCSNDPESVFELVRSCFPTLSRLIYHPDEEVLSLACWTISYLSDGANEKVQAIIDVGAYRRLVELLVHPSSAIQGSALRTVGNIVAGNDTQIQSIINRDPLPALLALLSSPEHRIRVEACRTIRNITYGNEQRIQTVIDNNIVPKLIQLLFDANNNIRNEAVLAISSIIGSGNTQQIKFLVAQGCIQPLCDFLLLGPDFTVKNLLHALKSILEVGEQDMLQGIVFRKEMAHFISVADGDVKIKVFRSIIPAMTSKQRAITSLRHTLAWICRTGRYQC